MVWQIRCGFNDVYLSCTGRNLIWHWVLKGWELPILIWVSNPYIKHEVTLMINPNNPIIKHKGGLLNLAEQPGNLSKACKIMGLLRDTFCRWPLKGKWPALPCDWAGVLSTPDKNPLSGENINGFYKQITHTGSSDELGQHCTGCLEGQRYFCFIIKSDIFPGMLVIQQSLQQLVVQCMTWFIRRERTDDVVATHK